MKVDPYHHREKWIKWKNQIQKTGVIPDLSRENSDIILKYLKDMEMGINTAIGSVKGGRSFIRLNTIKRRLSSLLRMFYTYLEVNDITKITEEQLCSFFVDMRNGIITRQDGQRYRATKDFVKIFKSFWHWYQKVSKKAGKEVEDITVYLDATGEKPEWV
ncbi:hypothetical protein HN747_01195, partial [archaeon]|nr:hypothetical protein [archaeon]